MDQVSYAATSPDSSLPMARRGQESGLTVLTRWVDLFLTWHQRRRSRADLAGMPDLMLKDIGLSRGDAEQEWEKPFWRA